MICCDFFLVTNVLIVIALDYKHLLNALNVNVNVNVIVYFSYPFFFTGSHVNQPIQNGMALIYIPLCAVLHSIQLDNNKFSYTFCLIHLFIILFCSIRCPSAILF